MSDYINSQSNFRQPYNSGVFSGYQGGPPRMQSQINPPPLPSRTSQSTIGQYGGMYGNRLGFGNYASYGGMGSYGGYGGFGNFGGYGSYGGIGSYQPMYGNYGYGPYGQSITPENRFIQMAEQSARPAFESFQSLLGVLGSITMMFESTFHAIHSSYSSVLGVADNFSKLRGMFGSVFSAISVVRALSWLYRRILTSLGLRRADPWDEATWSSLWGDASGDGSNPAGAPGSPSGWPTLLFLSLILAGPYLIFRLLNKLYPAQNIPPWDPHQQAGTMYTAQYDFSTQIQEELPFRKSQHLMIAPQQYQKANSGWLLACSREGRIGLVPGNYLAPTQMAPTDRSMPSTSSSTPSSSSSIFENATFSNPKPPTIVNDLQELGEVPISAIPTFPSASVESRESADRNGLSAVMENSSDNLGSSQNDQSSNSNDIPRDAVVT